MIRTSGTNGMGGRASSDLQGRPRLARRRLALYHCAILALCAVSVYLFYSPPVTSPLVSRAFGGLDSANREFMRSVVLVVLAYLANLVLSRDSSSLWPVGKPPGRQTWWPWLISRSERSWLVIACALLVGYFFYAPIALKSRYPNVSGSLFRDAVLPYAVYFWYSLACYILLGFPLTVALVRSIKTDMRRSREYEHQLVSLSALSLSDTDDTSTALVTRYMSQFIAFRVHRIRIGGRYLWLVVLFVIYFVVEFSSATSDTLTPLGQDFIKGALWFLAIAAFVGICYSVARYSTQAEKAMDWLMRCADFAQTRRDIELQRQVSNELMVLSGKLSPITFLGAMLKNLGLLSLFCVLASSVIASLLKTGAVASAVRLLFPRFVADFLLRIWKLLFPGG
jgi:hypothetical protein